MHVKPEPYVLSVSFHLVYVYILMQAFWISIHKSRGNLLSGERKKGWEASQRGGEPWGHATLNIWSLNHMSDDSESRTIINWADLKIDPESNSH